MLYKTLVHFNNIVLDSLPRFFFTPIRYAITRALLHIQSFPLSKYLIISDVRSILDSLVSYPFDSHFPSHSTRTRSWITLLQNNPYIVQILWVEGIEGVEGNKKSSSLVKTTNHFQLKQMPSKITFSDLISDVHGIIFNTRKAKWT